MIDEFCNPFREVPSDLVDESRGSIWHQIESAQDIWRPQQRLFVQITESEFFRQVVRHVQDTDRV